MIRLTLILVSALFVGSAAIAYQDGNFKCMPYQEGLPDDQVRIQTLKINGLDLPHLEIVRHSKQEGRLVEARISGFATRFEIDGRESLMLGALEIYFENGKIRGCK